MHKAVVATRSLAVAAKASGHKLHGVVQPPSKWAAAAGFQGSSASPLRAHIARQSDNGCGRTSRYGAVDAQGMINLIDLGVQFTNADTPTKQSTVAKKTRTALDKAKAAARSGAKQEKAKAKAKPKTPAKRQVKKEKTTA